MKVRRLAVIFAACSVACVAAVHAQDFAPRLAADINTKPCTTASSNPGSTQGLDAAELFRGVIFTARSRSESTQLWISDGSGAGTSQVSFKPADMGNSHPVALGPDAAIVFNGNQLWGTDGTSDHTDVYYSFVGTGPSPRGVLHGVAYFQKLVSTGNELWRTDGTSDGTWKVTALPSNTSIVAETPNKLYFTASTSAEGSELWVTDGTAVGTMLVKDIYPGTQSTSILLLGILGDSIVFRGRTPTAGNEPWFSDGTPAGTMMLKDISPGTSSSGISFEGVSTAQGVYFAATNPSKVGDNAIWKTNGTVAGTTMVAQSSTNELWSDVRAWAVTGNKVVFTSQKSGGVPSKNLFALGTSTGTVEQLTFFTDTSLTVKNSYESPASALMSLTHESVLSLWATNGSAAGTRSLGDIWSGAIYFLGQTGGMTLFQADDGVHGEELWGTDSTPEGTYLVKDIYDGAGESVPKYGLVGVAGHLFLDADDGDHGRELWTIDPVTGLAAIVKDIQPGPRDSVGGTLACTASTVLFPAAQSGASLDPWGSDGTLTGTVNLLHEDSGAVFAQWVSHQFMCQDHFAAFVCHNLFSAETYGDLALTDGTPQGTTLIDIDPSKTDELSVMGVTAARIGQSLLFKANHSMYGSEPWISDGTPGGTRLLLDINPGTPGSNPGSFLSDGNRAFFAASSPATGTEVFVTDGTGAGTIVFAEAVVGTGGSSSVPLCVLHGRLLFLATTPASGKELWISDGTPAGTTMVKEIAAGTIGISMLRTDEFGIQVLGDRAVLLLDDGVHGREPWVTDGTSAGTFILGDLNPGASGSSSYLWGRIGTWVFFAASTPDVGGEMWVTDGTITGTRLTGEIVLGAGYASFPSDGLNPLACAVGGTLYFAAYRPDVGEELFMIRPCRADFDNSGFIDTDDFDVFVRAFEAGTDNADMDGSGFVDTDDFDFFVRAFEAGC